MNGYQVGDLYKGLPLEYVLLKQVVRELMLANRIEEMELAFVAAENIYWAHQPLGFVGWEEVSWGIYKHDREVWCYE